MVVCVILDAFCWIAADKFEGVQALQRVELAAGSVWKRRRRRWRFDNFSSPDAVSPAPPGWTRAADDGAVLSVFGVRCRLRCPVVPLQSGRRAAARFHQGAAEADRRGVRRRRHRDLRRPGLGDGVGFGVGSGVGRGVGANTGGRSVRRAPASAPGSAAVSATVSVRASAATSASGSVRALAAASGAASASVSVPAWAPTGTARASLDSHISAHMTWPSRSRSRRAWKRAVAGAVRAAARVASTTEAPGSPMTACSNCSTEFASDSMCRFFFTFREPPT